MWLKSWSFAGLALALVGCFGEDTAPPVREVPVSGVGGACTIATDCREGLACRANRCEPSGDKAEGASCRLSGECQEALYCGSTGVCETAGDNPRDAACGTAADCLAGLYCQPTGLSGVCAQPGMGDIGQPCQGAADCLAGLGCAAPPGGAARTCQGSLEGGVAAPFVGVECGGEDEGPLRVYFEVPDGSSPDFYRLPFPNDARRLGTRPLLDDHPTPGVGALGFDLVRKMLDVIGERQQGFGLNQATFLRFSGRLNLDTLDASGENPSHVLVGISPESPDYGQNQPIFWQASTGRGRYICQNWLAVRPSWGRALEPNATYAVLITDTARGEDGQQLEQDADFAAMLQEERPQQTRLVEAWNAYRPLREYLIAQSIPAASIKGAAVYTTGDPRAVARQLRGAVRGFGLPQLSDLTLCATDTPSPCDDGLGGEAHQRGCMGRTEGFDELHGRLLLPIFQQGEAPYLVEGGGVEVGVEGPVIQRNEQVCAAMTVPSQDMPEEGWPVLIFAHGTGGSYRSHVGEISSLVSAMGAGDRATGMIVIGWDQVQHFTRRGASAQDPESLVFNALNPEAAQGNFLQGAADLHAITAFVENLDIAAADSPTGKRVKVDPSRIYFLGHSQGGTSGAIALPFEPAIKGAVLSGTGGSLTYALLGKTNPFNAANGVRIALQDPDIGENHPVLSLIQGFFEPVDPINYAQYIGARQIEGVTTPRHVLHAMGIGDTFTPTLALEAMATGLRSGVAAPLITPFQRRTVSPSMTPISGNLTVNGQPMTVVSRQYEPIGYDGHFVLFRETEAIDDLIEFLSTAVLDGVPTIAD